MENWSYSNAWYHGSPLELETLLTGSTITQDRGLARIFSHKPTVVCWFIQGDVQQRKHSGKQPGYLYQIAEEIGAEDVYPHPNSSMEPGLEWLTKREIKLALIGPTRIQEEETLTEEETAKLKEQYAQRKKQEKST